MRVQIPRPVRRKDSPGLHGAQESEFQHPFQSILMLVLGQGITF